MAQEIDIRTTAAASVEQVWRLLDDSSTWPSWTPIDSFVLIRPGDGDGPGEIREFVTGRYTVREEIVERRRGSRLSYVLLSGLPLRDYRADIDLTPRGDGTHIHWHTSFESKVPGMGGLYRRGLAKVTRRFVDGLAEHAAATDGAQRVGAQDTGGTGRR